MKNILGFLAVALIAGGTMFAQPRVSIGIGVGGYARGYYAPPVYSQAVPAYPGPGYAWVDGYWGVNGGRYVWVPGRWDHPPYAGAYWVEPYHVGGQYFTGRWEGSRGNVAHDHRWDRGAQRDERREPRPDDRNDSRR